VEAQEASGRRGDPSGGLTSNGGAVRRTSDGGEQSSTVSNELRGTDWREGEERRARCGEEARRSAVVEY
jgi:hypothetical protein